VQSLRRPPNFFQTPNLLNDKPFCPITLQDRPPALLPYRRIGVPVSAPVLGTWKPYSHCPALGWAANELARGCPRLANGTACGTKSLARWTAGDPRAPEASLRGAPSAGQGNPTKWHSSVRTNRGSAKIRATGQFWDKLVGGPVAAAGDFRHEYRCAGEQPFTVSLAMRWVRLWGCP